MEKKALSAKKEVVLNGCELTIEEVVKVAREYAPVSIDPECRKEILRVREQIEKQWISEDAPPAYGFNTGVGKLKYTAIDPEQNDLFQHHLVMSHCGGVGEPLSEEVVRATMLVRLNAFCQGVSGLRWEVIERLMTMLNKGVHPVIPLQGSVGASGDLAPLAHMVSVLIGYEKAEAFYQSQRMSAREALEQAGIAQVAFELKAKDCLALINGTTVFAAMAALNCHDAEKLANTCEISAALSLEAVRGETAAFDPRIHKARRHKGQIDCAHNIRKLIEGSGRVTEEARKIRLPHDVLHPEYKPRVQDLYSLRCVPQVQGAVRDNLEYVHRLIEEEINAATDNPLVFWEEDGSLMFYSGGNFHGQSVAYAMDILAMSVAELGSISERRTFQMLDPTLSYGLPPNLAGEPVGLNYGYGIIACSASALVSENKTLCQPASVDSIPTKSNQEDHVSMAPWAARKAGMVIDNVEKILGIELMIGAEAISLTETSLGSFSLGIGTNAAYQRIRQDIKAAYKDTYMPDQSLPAIKLVKERHILQAVEEAVDGLKF
ncbi:MAG: histidine ammonia-lyase [Tindallia sp. MSAO_Bac2]|nr:MAG: histidine ammonia-lyase [Tindallia sp. MSAO_Bac2]